MPDIGRAALAGATGKCANPSQMLHFGLRGWAGTAGLKSTDKAPHLGRVAQVPAPPAYRLAYARWERGLETARASCAPLKADTRVFIGMSEAGMFETGITLQLPYGVPVIPGSACKGLARRVARAVEGTLPESGVEILFGDTGGAGQGHVIFHDAWWVADSAPGRQRDRALVREVVTPHHKDFLDSRGRNAATPFDSPEPIPQLAAHGAFLFAIEGPQAWAALGLELLRIGLRHEGIGARTPEYGTFTNPMA
jgi:CRISPR-associated protein Cmr6